MDAFFKKLKEKFQKGGEKKDYDKTYKDIYKKEGRVTPYYKNQKEIETNIHKDNKTHNKKFKTVSAVNKAGKQDVSKATSNKEAFAIARNTHKKNYKYKGKTYSTRYKEETPEQFEKSHQPNTPENRARVRDVVKRKGIGRSVAAAKGGDRNYIDPATKWSNKGKKKNKKYGGSTRGKR
jgi:hypothetical protein